MEFTIWQSYNIEDVIVLGMHVGENDDIAHSFVNSFGLTYPVLRDVSGSAYNEYSVIGISPFPLDVIIDQDGILRYVNSEYDPQIIVETITDLLAITTIDEDLESPVIPQEISIRNYPNPFNPLTNFDIQLTIPGYVELDIYSVDGRHVSSIISGQMTAGNHRVQWDGSIFSSGVYLYTLRSGGLVRSGKTILLR